MQLACQVADDLYSGNGTSVLDTPNKDADICYDREVTFNDVLKSYLEKKKDLYKKQEEPNERVTRSVEFSIIDAKQASELYITQLWKAVRERCKFTDISDSPCSFSEAPAEGIFSVNGHVL